MIKLDYYDNTYVKISSNSESEMKMLYEMFSIDIPGIKYTEQYKSGFIDGKKHLMDKQGKLLYGLKKKAIDFCASNNIEYQDNVPVLDSGITREEFYAFCKTIMKELPFKPYAHQLKGAYLALKNKRMIPLSATGSGKSFIIYLMIRWYIYKNMKNMLIVPGISLTSQMLNDFNDYFTIKFNELKKLYENETDSLEQANIKNEIREIVEARRNSKCLDINDYVTIISSGADKHTNHLCKISTYQSLSIDQNRVDREYFKDVQAIIIDETHKASAKTIYDILDACVDAEYRIGLTGSLGDSNLDNLIIEGLIGSVETIISMRELIDLGLATEIVINPLYIQYADEEAKLVKKMSWQEEDKFIRTHESRNEFIAKLANSFPNKNVMVIYKNIDNAESMISHNARLRDAETNLKVFQKDNEHKLYFSRGNTKAKDRELFRGLLEKSVGNILYGTTSIIATGVNIKNLHVIIFASIGKSPTLVIQGLGRSARLHESKSESLVYDIVDDLRYYSRNGREYPNTSFKHWESRFDIYTEHEYIVQEPKKIKIKKTNIL